MLAALVLLHGALNGHKAAEKLRLFTLAFQTNDCIHQYTLLHNLKRQGLGGAGGTNDDQWHAELDADDDGEHVFLRGTRG